MSGPSCPAGQRRDVEADDAALLRYSRHILLPEVDLAGQRRIAAARVLVVGVGGLGSPAALYLAASGVGRLTLADDDVVELSNLQRQIVHDSAALGRPKVESARDRLAALNPDVELVPLARRLDGDALAQAIAAHDVVLDCSDNFATRGAVNRGCVAARVPLVSAAAVRFSGQLMVFDPRHDDSPCYHCLFPDEGEGDDGPCALFGVFAPLLGVMGSLQAAEALKLILDLPAALGTLTRYDARSGQFRHSRVRRDPGCGVCGVG